MDLNLAVLIFLDSCVAARRHCTRLHAHREQDAKVDNEPVLRWEFGRKSEDPAEMGLAPFIPALENEVHEKESYNY